MTGVGPAGHPGGEPWRSPDSPWSSTDPDGGPPSPPTEYISRHTPQQGPGQIPPYHPSQPGTYPSPPNSARPLLRRILWTGGLALLFTLGGSAVIVATGLEVGAFAGIIGALAALLPLAVVIPAVLWLDRFEAEPTRYLVVSFLWGACVATVGALLLNTTATFFLGGVGAQQTSMIYVAPVVEEFLKGFGVLLMLLLRRREFDGIVDGIVYASICAAGFAFAENIIYLGRAYGEQGADGLLQLLVLRGVIGLFSHPMFTSCFGIGLGIAASRPKGLLTFAAPALGLIVAVLSHGFWNYSAVTVTGENSLMVFTLRQIPLFVVMGCGIVWAHRRERRVIGNELDECVRTGWLRPFELTMLTSSSRRREAIRSAKAYGLGRDMQRFQDQAIELALLRLRMHHGHAARDARLQEMALLQEISSLRAVLDAGLGGGTMSFPK